MRMPRESVDRSFGRRRLEEQHCDALIREPFIAALARWHDPVRLVG